MFRAVHHRDCIALPIVFFDTRNIPFLSLPSGGEELHFRVYMIAHRTKSLNLSSAQEGAFCRTPQTRKAAFLSGKKQIPLMQKTVYVRGISNYIPSSFFCGE